MINESFLDSLDIMFSLVKRKSKWQGGRLCGVTENSRQIPEAIFLTANVGDSAPVALPRSHGISSWGNHRELPGPEMI